MSDQDHKAHHETTFNSGQITTTLHDDDDMVRDLYYFIKIDASTITRMLSVEVKLDDKLRNILKQIKEDNAPYFSAVNAFDIVILQNESDADVLKLGTRVSDDMGTEAKPLYIIIDKVVVQRQGTICIYAAYKIFIYFLTTCDNLNENLFFFCAPLQMLRYVIFLQQ
jgi:hypothetical protein